MLTLAAPSVYQQEIKKSRFIARAERCDRVEQALAFLERARKPQATHNCWAYLIGQQLRFSDDGEPGGTAGRPILLAIENQQLDHVAVVVTRFFGGIKLGAGGLARAYGGTAAKCLAQADKLVVKPTRPLRLHALFQDTGAIYPLLERFRLERLAETFDDRGVTIDLALPIDELDSFEREVMDATNGRATLSPPM